MKKKLTFTKEEIAGIKKASTDSKGLSDPSKSVEAFSVADIPFGDSHNDSKDKMGLYLELLKTGPEPVSDSTIFDRALKLNEVLSPKLLLDEIVHLYNHVVLYGKSYTKIVIDDPRFNALKIDTTLSFSELMTQSFPKARYIVEPFFEQGTVNMVSAPPNTWKSWLLFLCSIHIADGSLLLGQFPTEQSKVMIVNEEDSFRAIQDRFRILNVTDTNLPLFFRVANGSKLETKFITALIDELKEKQIGVVIFDSLRSMHEADENDSTAMQRILDQMKKIAREGVTVIFTHHHRKKGLFEKGSSAESSRGSSAINAAISGHLSLDEEERETGLFLVVRHLKSKAGEKLPPFEIKIVKSEGKVLFQYDGEFKQAEKKLKQTKDQIMEMLNDSKWKCKKDFEEKITVSKTILHQAIQSLKNDGVLIDITRGQAITKSIPVREKGKVNELYYSFNTESAELVTRHDHDTANQEFLDY